MAHKTQGNIYLLLFIIKEKDEQVDEGIHSARSSRLPITEASVPTGTEYTSFLAYGYVHQLRRFPNPIAEGFL